MKISLIITLIFVQTTLWGQKTFNLQQCLDYAYKQNFDIKQRELRLKQSENTLSQSRQAVFPNLSGSFSQGINSGRSIDPFSNDFVQRTISSNSFGFNGGFTVFNGFSLKNQILQNEYIAQADEWEILRGKNELRIRITLAYMQVLMNQELWKTAQEQVTSLQNQIIQIKELIKEGNKAKTNLIDLEAQLATAEFDALNAKNNIEISKLSLAQLMAYPNYNSFELEGINIDDKTVVLNESFLQNIVQGIQNQPIIKSSELRVQSSKVGVRIAEAGKYPTVSLGVGLGSGYSSAASGEFSYFKQLDFNLNQNARIGVNIPIYSNGQVRGRINNSVIARSIVETQLQQTKLQLKQEIEQAYLTARTAQERLNSAKRQVMAQQTAYESAQERFKEGLLNTIDLNTFRLNLERAKSNLIQSRYEFFFRKMILEYYRL
ncbi:MAG: TolC family protein [Spirosomaceae bacterium]|jgi:outer membrane protein|nr:TolC family protein [Spirosomataceae bacterium]